jgi:tRNA (adenine22-N1)-methyltransferase
MINLKGRLQKVASMVDHCKKPADIGTDHAYLPIYLVQSGICPMAIATDIKKGPLRKAEKNIIRYHMQDKIELRLGDGLIPIKDDGCDVLIIAGMGGVLIRDIIEKSIDTARKAKYIVMQPMYAEEALREFLLRYGFNIMEESLAKHEGRIYPVIKGAYDGIVREEDIFHLYIGRRLFEQRDPLLKEFLRKRIKRQDRVVQGMSKSLRMKEAHIKENSLLIDMKKAYDEITW